MVYCPPIFTQFFDLRRCQGTTRKSYQLKRNSFPLLVLHICKVVILRVLLKYKRSTKSLKIGYIQSCSQIRKAFAILFFKNGVFFAPSSLLLASLGLGKNSNSLISDLCRLQYRRNLQKSLLNTVVGPYVFELFKG